MSLLLIIKRMLYVEVISAIILISCFKCYRFRWLSTALIILFIGRIVTASFNRIGICIHPYGYGILVIALFLAIILLVLQLFDLRTHKNDISVSNEYKSEM
jgi:hypothetical protein